MRGFVYERNGHFRDDTTPTGTVTLAASGRLTTKHHDDDQSPQQQQINREKCCHCAAVKEHTQWAHEDEVYG